MNHDWGILFEPGAHVGSQPVTCHLLGELDLPTGRLVLQPEGPVEAPLLALRVAPGRYPVTASRVGGAAPRHAAVQLGQNKPVAWLQAKVAPSNEARRLAAWRARERAAAGLMDKSRHGGADWTGGAAPAVTLRAGVLRVAGALPSVIVGHDAAGLPVVLVFGDALALPIEYLDVRRRGPAPQRVPGASRKHRVGPTRAPWPRRKGAPGFEAIFAENGACLDAGPLVVTTGKIVACDPLVFLAAPPLALDVPVGLKPVVIALLEDKVAAALVRIGDGVPVRWIPAATAGEPENGDVRSYPVDSGTGAYLDLAAADALLRAQHRGEQLDLLAQLQAAKLSERKVANLPVAGSNLVAFQSGDGDGCYPTFLGHDKRGRPVAIVTAFLLDE